MPDWRANMVGRPLSPEEKQIWSKVTQTVAPLKKQPVAAKSESVQPFAEAVIPSAKHIPVQTRAPTAKKAIAQPVNRSPVPVLDDSWERRIATGALIPEMTVDLHGHTLEAAHRRLNQTLGQALSRNVRVLLVITGNPRPVASSSPHGERARGAIRAEIGDWLAHSGHADAIASVRNAHPRHGGKGALYIILRRRK